MAVSSTYVLNVNADGSQHTDYPAGDKEENEVVVDPPTNVTASNPTTSTVDISWAYTGSGHTGFIVDQYRGGGPWTTVATLSATARFFQATGLPGNTQVGHRVRAESGGILSAWSQEAWLSTLGSQPGGEYAGLSPNRYVTASATGGGSGSESSPWHLEEAMLYATAGDVVGIKPGIYAGYDPRPGKDPYDPGDAEGYRLSPFWKPRGVGTASNRIYFVAQYPAATHDNQALYTDLRSGSDGKDPNTGGTYYFPTSDGSHASQFGWPVFGGGGGDGHYCTWVGIYSNEEEWNNKICEDAGNCTVRNVTGHEIYLCKIIGEAGRVHQDNNYSGVRCENAHDAKIQDNFIHGYGVNGNNNCAGILNYSTTYGLWENNTITDCMFAVQMKGARSYDNWGSISYNRVDGCYHFLHLHSLRQLNPDGSLAPIRHNLVTNCNYMLYFTTSGGERYQNHLDVQHNTVDSDNDYRGDIFFASSVGTPRHSQWRNNILTNSNALTGSDSGVTDGTMEDWADYDYNCFHNVPYASVPGSTTDWATWQSAGSDVNSVFADPKFIGGGDYRLQGDSPCRGNGEGGTTIGCYVSGNEKIGVRA